MSPTHQKLDIALALYRNKLLELDAKITCACASARSKFFSAEGDSFELNMDLVSQIFEEIFIFDTQRAEVAAFVNTLESILFPMMLQIRRT